MARERSHLPGSPPSSRHRLPVGTTATGCTRRWPALLLRHLADLLQILLGHRLDEQHVVSVEHDGITVPPRPRTVSRLNRPACAAAIPFLGSSHPVGDADLRLSQPHLNRHSYFPPSFPASSISTTVHGRSLSTSCSMSRSSQRRESLRISPSLRSASSSGFAPGGHCPGRTFRGPMVEGHGHVLPPRGPLHGPVHLGHEKRPHLKLKRLPYRYCLAQCIDRSTFPDRSTVALRSSVRPSPRPRPLVRDVVPVKRTTFFTSSSGTHSSHDPHHQPKSIQISLSLHNRRLSATVVYVYSLTHRPAPHRFFPLQPVL